MAFERWLKVRRERGREEVCDSDIFFQKKQTEDEAIKKEQAKQAELARMNREVLKERQKRAEMAFNTWKHHKEFQQEMDRQLTTPQYSTPPRHPPTPPLTGYCSVWSCDEDMAKFFVSKVRRSGSFDLSDIHSYIHNTEDDNER